MKKIYDEYDLNVKMNETPVGFTLKTKNNESNYASCFFINKTT